LRADHARCFSARGRIEHRLLGSGVEDAKEILGIPPERRVRSALSLGYPKEEVRRARTRPGQARKPLTDLLHEERYGTEARR
jgi:hypothetical protein